MATVQGNIFAVLDGEETDDVQQLVEHVKAKASSRPSTAEKAENDKDKKVQHTDNARGQNVMNGRGRGQGRGSYNGRVFYNTNNYYSRDNNGYANGNHVDHWRQGHNGNYQQNYGAYPRGGRGGSFRGRGGRGEIRAFQLHNQSKDMKEKEVATSNGNQVEVPKEETEEDKAKREEREKELKAKQEQRDKEYMARQEERENERKKMTFQQYEKLLAEKRKALEANKSEERKVELDKELKSMQLVRKNKEHDDTLIKLNSEKDKLKKDKDEKCRRATMSIDEFLKRAEEEEKKRQEIRQAEEERRRQQLNRQKLNRQIQRPRRSILVEDNSATANGGEGVGKPPVEEFPILAK